ncbi:MAG: hypothetical protein D6739_01390 [Nitrospirae bacterium]|nr:MAG: hypothetical protein D6739_01390 [Nitrospirota bacterium]
MPISIRSLALALPALLLAAACGGGGSSGLADTAAPATAEDDAAVATASLDDAVGGEALLADDLLDDLAPDGAVYPEGVAASSVGSAAEVEPAPPVGLATLPVAWGRRRIGPVERAVQIEQQGDVAHVTVVSQVHGRLYVDRSDDGVRNPGSKPFAHTVRRLATFERDAAGWHLAAISPAEVQMAEAERQVVHIEEVAATVGDTVVARITDPAEELPLPGGLPTLEPGEEVVVTAKVSHDPGSPWSPETFVFLHHGGHRDPMVDDGTGADAVAGDGVYTAAYTVAGRLGRRLAVVDALDAACLQNETEDDYAAHGWAIPYRVVATEGAAMDADEAAVRALVESEPLLAPPPPFDHLAGRDDEALASAGSGLPEHWGRRPTGPRERTVDVHIEGGVAEVAVHSRWPGRLYVDTSFDGIFNPGVKPTDETAVHRLRYEKVAGRWRLAALSLGDIRLTETERQHVAIVGITVRKDGGPAYAIDDPAALQRVGDGLFTVARGTVVTVAARAVTREATEALPPFLFLHANHHRRLMVDDGTHGDAVAGDGIYTARFVAGPGRGRHRFVVDAIDRTTLANESEDDYDSERWVVPYRVVRPHLLPRLPFRPDPRALRRLP